MHVFAALALSGHVPVQQYLIGCTMLVRQAVIGWQRERTADYGWLEAAVQ